MSSKSFNNSLPGIVIAALIAILCSAAFNLVQAGPLAGWVEQDYAVGLAAPVGIVWGPASPIGNGERAYIWEKAGRVLLFQNGAVTNVLLDIRDEVNGCCDHGLLGFALHPNFKTNGYFYTFYVVEKSALGIPTAQDTAGATISRLTRWTADPATSFTTIIPGSKKILIGATITTGVPVLSTTHGVGAIAFGVDGYLYLSHGDGAGYDGADTKNNEAGAFGVEGLALGIINNAMNIGAYRAQSLDSMNGKVLRVDPETGAGVAGNPFFTGGVDPFSPRARIYALGLRNPYRWSFKPGTNTIYLGDVGLGNWEELNVVKAGNNHGWPFYEGNTQNGLYIGNPYGMPIPTNYVAPRYAWRGNAQVRVGNTVSNLPNQYGDNFGGSCSIGGVFLQAAGTPPDLVGAYLHADFTGNWIRSFRFDGQDEPVPASANFYTGDAVAANVVFMTTHPTNGGVYYANIWANAIKRIVPATANTPPTAVITTSAISGNSPLTITFDGSKSSDSQGRVLTYLWTFGDGTTSTAVSPVKTFTATGITKFTVTLRVTNTANSFGTATVTITVNDNPPAVAMSQPANNCIYPVSVEDYRYIVKYAVSDPNHAVNTLTSSMKVILHHDTHFHLESDTPLDLTQTSKDIVIAPLGCGSATYWYCVQVTVTNPSGLSTTAENCMYPEGCGRTGPQCLGGSLASSCSILADSDLFGGDLKDDQGQNVILADAQVGQCCTGCQQITGCYAWTWFQNTCYFKGIAAYNAQPATLVGAVSGKLKQLPTVPPPTPAPTPAPTTCSAIEENTDYPGNDIANTVRATADLCCADCKANVLCQVYVWTNYQGGTCWLKSAKGAKATVVGARASSIVAVPVTTAPVTTAPATTAPVTTAPVTTAPATTAPATTAPATTKPPATTAPPAPTCSALELNVDYFGNDLKNTPRAAAGLCCQDCLATAGCKVFVWTNYAGGTCWLKSAAGAKSTLVGASAAQVVTAPVTTAPVTTAPVTTAPITTAPVTTAPVTTAPATTAPATTAPATTKPPATTAPPAPTCSALELNVDYAGNDLKNTPRAAAGLCCQDCLATAGCKLFVWTNYLGGTCWLKSAAGAKSTLIGASAAQVITGPVTTAPVTTAPVTTAPITTAPVTTAPVTTAPATTAPPVTTAPVTTAPAPSACYPIKANSDYAGNDVGEAASPTVAGCCAACNALTACNAYSWSNFNGGTCWLKSKAGPATTVTGTSAGIFYKCGKLETGVDYVGNDLANAPGATPEVCCGICRSTTGCAAFTHSGYNGGTCWLKRAKTTTAAVIGATSATIV